MTSVFISSTSRDLEAYRKAVIEICNRLQMIPIAMEFFESMGVGATEGSKRKLDEADVYIGIFAHRYGYVEEGYDRSVTEIEFDYASERGLQRLCFLVDPDYKWEPSKIDFKNYARLEAFKERINKLIRSLFTDENDLSAKVMQSLVAWRDFNTPRPALRAVLIATSEEIPNFKENKFVGRRSLLASIQSALKRERRVLLQGAPGTGKTATAAAITAKYLKSGTKGLLWLQAGDAAADSLLEALAAPFENRRSVIEVAGDARNIAMKNLLTGVPLVVLDDVWNGQALYQVLNAFPGETAVLVTSRRRYPGLNLIPIEPLSRPDSLKVLSRYAGHNLRADPDANRLCERLGDLAFALMIAGLTMGRDSDDLSAGELLGRINDAPQDLNLPLGFAEEGKESVAALLHTSLNHRTLEPAARGAFFAIGALFTHTVTPALLSLYLGDGNVQLADKYLDALRDHGLVERIKPGGDHLPYYRVHDLIYTYARSQASEVDRLKAMETCQRYVEMNAKDSRALEAEINNILGAAEAAAAPLPNGLGRDDALIDLVYRLAVSDDLPYFEARGYTPRMFVLMQKAIDAAQQKSDLKTVYNLVEKLGYAYISARNLEKAFELHEQALSFAEQLNDHTYQAIIRARFGSIWFQRNHHNQAEYSTVEAHYAEAEKIARTHNDEYALAHVLQNQGFYYLNKQSPDFQHSVECSDQAAQLAFRPDLDIRRIYFTAMLNRGGGEADLGQIERAIATHQAVYKFAQEQGNPLWMAHARWSLAEDYHKQGDHQKEAQQAFDEAFELFCQWEAHTWSALLAGDVTEMGYVVQPQFKECIQ